MDGQLSVASEYGVGSTFSLELPLEAAAPLAEESNASPKAQSGTTASIEPPKKRPLPAHNAAQNDLNILIVSDDETQCEAIRAFLKHPRINLEFVTDDADMLDVLSGANFNLVLMDVSISFERRLDALKLIRQNEASNGCSRVPIICPLDPTLMDKRDVLSAAGMDAHLLKPVQKQPLLEAVSFWIKASKANEVSAAA